MSKLQLRSWRDWMRFYFAGMCFGLADIVPGISSGTVAFILGLYETLLDSIRSFNGHALSELFHLRLRSFFSQIAWEFFLALGLGVATTFVLLSRLINDLLGDPTYRVFLFALFTGLVTGAAYFCSRQVSRWHVRHTLLFITAAIAALVLTLSRSTTEEAPFTVKIPQEQLPPAALSKQLVNYDPATQRLSNISESTLSAMLAKGIVNGHTEVYHTQQQRQGVVEQFVTGRPLSRINGWLFLCGLLGVSAMLLPGISGSYMLTILGAYPVAITALADLLNGLGHLEIDSDAFFTLASIFLGMVTGAVVLSRVLSWLLKTYHDLTIATLTGSMIGALPAVWPFWSYVYMVPPLRLDKAPQLQVIERLWPDVASPTFWIACFCVGAGISIVLTLEWLSAHRIRDAMQK